jgi:hypothetical protein
MWKYISITVLVVLIIAGAILTIMRNDDGKTDVTVTVEGIKDIAQLATVEYTISEVVKVTLPKEGYEWQNAQFLVILTGKVSGNIDLDKVKVDITKENDKTIAILDFEKGAILIKNPQVSPDDLKIITISDPNIFNKIDDDDRNQAFNCASSQMLRAAEDQGIRRKTADEAQIVLTRFLQEMGVEVKITFVEEDLAPKEMETSICVPSKYESMN